MSRQVRRTRPGDVANAFVRYLLSEASEVLGGFNEEEWEATLDFFDRRCAYTDEPLDDGGLERDHAIPLSVHRLDQPVRQLQRERRLDAGLMHGDAHAARGYDNYAISVGFWHGIPTR